ncbi:nucleotide exchange factor GrpE [Mycoplasma sp. 'Moose RK']|uniref:nucleotide exchange factor GrpE n=1 Tax=Mycoplasma sp. 'Moose RK' TaxID=2780095 RepID=UPI0018C25514|nr:nucleotide exchange factor GrpE [Mycoplasma sp. 'Moose RK']MBG0730509.1 nucleotide exchange factor GrpE [Mycoplasma sp. 'Moose RK']
MNFEKKQDKNDSFFENKAKNPDNLDQKIKKVVEDKTQETTNFSENENSEKSKRFFKKENKSQIKNLENQIQNLTTKNITLEIESAKLREKIKKMEEDFKIQVKNFEEKAAQKVNDLKVELQKKLEDEVNLIKKYSLQPFFEAFSSPFLNLKKAVSFGSKSENHEILAYVKGFEMLVVQVENILENFGITKIEPEIGDVFDSSIHEVYQLSEGEPDRILNVTTPGYKLHDRTIKTALVVVGKLNEQKN